MSEYHVGCGLAGIYAGRLNNKRDEWLAKSDVTQEAIRAVATHLMPLEDDEIQWVDLKTKDGKIVRLSVEYIDGKDNEVIRVNDLLREIRQSLFKIKERDDRSVADMDVYEEAIDDIRSIVRRLPKAKM